MNIEKWRCECSQCVIDEVDTKLEDLFNRVNSTSPLGWIKDELKDEIQAIRDEIRPLVSC